MSHECNSGQCNSNQKSFWDYLKGDTRPVLIHDIVTLTMPLRFCMMYLPFFGQIYGGFMNTYSSLISMPITGLQMWNQTISSAPGMFKRVVGGFLPYLAIFIYFVHEYVVSTLAPNWKEQSSDAIDNLQTLQYLVIFAAIVMLLSSPGDLKNLWTEQEVKDLQTERPEFTTSRCLCQQCQKPKVARSNHCPLCQTCIPRQNEHSQVFNVCVGAKNIIQFYVFTVLATVYIWALFYNSTRYLNKEFKAGAIKLFYQVVLLYLVKKFTVQSLVYLNLMCSNLTLYEAANWQRISYMWKNRARVFYNPFTLGIFGNIYELFVPFLHKKQQSETSYDFEQNSSVQDDEGQEIYKEKYINWMYAKYYTVMDIFRDHPMKQQVFEELKQRGVIQDSQMSQLDMKREWKKYMKKQIEDSKKQKEFYKQQQKEMMQKMQQAKHVHGGNCNHGNQDNKQAPTIDPQQLQQQAQQNYQQMMQQRMMQQQMQQQMVSQATQQKTQGNSEETGGLLQSEDQDD